MKAKDIIAEIVKTSEYYELVRFWSLENGDEKYSPSEKIVEILRALSKRVDNEKKTFLCSFELRTREPHTNIIDFKVPREVQDAKDEFDRKLNKQMPVFTELMNSISIERLIPELIAM